MKEVDGIRYFNLSCCANTGYDGYKLREFALEHDPKLRAVVLLHNLQQPASTEIDRRGCQARCRQDPRSICRTVVDRTLPSIALRSVATDIFYSLFGHVVPRRNGLTDNLDAVKMMKSVHSERGWWGEHDPRNVGDKGKQFFSQLCGDPADLWNVGPASLNSTKGEFLPLVTFDKFAALAKSYDKKLIIVFHPHPCGQLNEQTLQALEDSVAQLKQKYSNLYVYPAGIFEHWPREIFTGADHLYLGYERFSSRRVGRFVADALGLPTTTTGDTPIPLPAPSLLRADEKPPAERQHRRRQMALAGCDRHARVRVELAHRGDRTSRAALPRNADFGPRSGPLLPGDAFLRADRRSHDQPVPARRREGARGLVLVRSRRLRGRPARRFLRWKHGRE